MSDTSPVTAGAFKDAMAQINGRFAAIEGAGYLATSAIADSSGGNTTVAGPDADGLYTITKAGGGDGWNASAVSAAPMVKDALIRIEAPIAPITYAMVGFSANPNVGDSYDDIGFALYFQTDGHVGEYRLGVDQGQLGMWVPGDRFWITQSTDGARITYWKGATLADAIPLRVVATTFAPLFLDSCIYTSGAQLKAGLFRRRPSI